MIGWFIILKIYYNWVGIGCAEKKNQTEKPKKTVNQTHFQKSQFDNWTQKNFDFQFGYGSKDLKID